MSESTSNGKEVLRKLTEGLDERDICSVMLTAKQTLAIAEYASALEADLDAVTTYAAVLEAAMEQICTDAKRVDVYSNGALLDLVQPFLIDRARAALKGEPLYTQEGNAQ